MIIYITGKKYESISEKINGALKNVSKWMKIIKFTKNISKPKHVIFGKRKYHDHHQLEGKEKW